MLVWIDVAAVAFGTCSVLSLLCRFVISNVIVPEFCRNVLATGLLLVELCLSLESLERHVILREQIAAEQLNNAVVSEHILLEARY